MGGHMLCFFFLPSILWCPVLTCSPFFLLLVAFSSTYVALVEPVDTGFCAGILGCIQFCCTWVVYAKKIIKLRTVAPGYTFFLALHDPYLFTYIDK